MPLLRDTINIYNYQFVASVNMVVFFGELMAKLAVVSFQDFAKLLRVFGLGTSKEKILKEHLVVD